MPARAEPLDAAAVGALFGVQGSTICKYLYESGSGRYIDNPFPAPDGRISGAPYWHANRVKEIKYWWLKSRPGRGVGGGRPRKVKVAV